MIFYEVFSTILFIIILPFWLVLGIFKPKFRYGLKEKLGFFTCPNLGEKVILFYGVSVGEVIALENLIKKTREQFSDYKIVITTGTKTGQDIAKKKLSSISDFITYFPLDFPPFINNFLNKIKPSIVIIAETELWPNFVTTIKRKNIPIFIINGRISDRTYKSYKRLSLFFKPILQKYTKILTQSKQDNQKLISIGANPETTTVMGNLKFDIKKPDLNIDLGQGRIIIAGSTHKGEDEIVLDTFKQLKQEFSDIKLLIAPRHPERNNAVFELIKKTNLACGKRSENANFNELDIILLDTMGELGKLYGLCYSAFIGGSFNKTGGHNPLEATIFNKPTISGPSTHNFKDIYALLTQSNASKIATTPKEFYLYLQKLLNDKDFYKKCCNDCEISFKENQGALEFVLKELKQTLN